MALPDLAPFLTDTPAVRLRRTQPLTAPPRTWVSVPWDFVDIDTHAGFDRTRPARFESRRHGFYQAVCTLPVTRMPRGVAHLDITGHTGGTAAPWMSVSQFFDGPPMPRDPDFATKMDDWRTRWDLLAVSGCNVEMPEWEWCEARFRFDSADTQTVVLPVPQGHESVFTLLWCQP